MDNSSQDDLGATEKQQKIQAKEKFKQMTQMSPESTTVLSTNMLKELSRNGSEAIQMMMMMSDDQNESNDDSPPAKDPDWEGLPDREMASPSRKKFKRRIPLVAPEWIKDCGEDFWFYAAVCFCVYTLGYLGWSFLWVAIPVTLYYTQKVRQLQKQSKIEYHRDISQHGEEAALRSRVAPALLPAWFQFPDVQRAEWINSLITIFWPHLTGYLEHVLRNRVEPLVREVLDSYHLWGFKFNTINFGNMSPRIEGLKVYINPDEDNEAALDAEISFTSGDDALLSISLLKFRASMTDIQVRGHCRLILKPLIGELPIVGGLQFFFLQPPSVQFDLGGAAQLLDLPGLNGILMSAINDNIAAFMVNPNKISLMLTDKVSPVDLKMPQPKGLFVIKICEARDLPDMDPGLSKCDPYVVVQYGSYESKTSVKSGVTPVWNETMTFTIDIPQSAEIQIMVLDKDTMSQDDLVGQNKISVEAVISEGAIDTWIPLTVAKNTGSQGDLRVQLQWMPVSTDVSDYCKTESKNFPARALLLLYLDSVHTRPIYADVPDIRVVMMTVIGKNKQESNRVRGRNPSFQEGHTFLLDTVENEVIQFRVMDLSFNADKGGEEMGQFCYPVSNLMSQKKLELPQQTYELDEQRGRIKFALKLRYLVSPPTPTKKDSSSVIKFTSHWAGKSMKLVKSVGKITIKEGVGVAKSVSSATSNAVLSIGSATSGAVNQLGSSTSSVIKKATSSSPFVKKKQMLPDYASELKPTLETHFDGDEPNTTMAVQESPVKSSRSQLDLNTPQSTSQGVRRRLSEGLKSFTFKM